MRRREQASTPTMMAPPEPSEVSCREMGAGSLPEAAPAMSANVIPPELLTRIANTSILAARPERVVAPQVTEPCIPPTRIAPPAPSLSSPLTYSRAEEVPCVPTAQLMLPPLATRMT